MEVRDYCVGPILPSFNGKILLFKIGFEICELGKKVYNRLYTHGFELYNYVRVYSTGI